MRYVAGSDMFSGFVCFIRSFISGVHRHRQTTANGLRTGWVSPDTPTMHRRLWQTTVSSSLTCDNAARPTRRCVLFDGHTTPSAIVVSQRLDHACGTHYLLRYDSCDSLGEFKRLLKTYLLGRRHFSSKRN